MKMRATRSGIHLFNRRTGFNLLVDEVFLRLQPNGRWHLVTVSLHSPTRATSNALLLRP